jgi:hypothetical protein
MDWRGNGEETYTKMSCLQATIYLKFADLTQTPQTRLLEIILERSWQHGSTAQGGHKCVLKKIDYGVEMNTTPSRLSMLAS